MVYVIYVDRKKLNKYWAKEVMLHYNFTFDPTQALYKNSKF